MAAALLRTLLSPNIEFNSDVWCGPQWMNQSGLVAGLHSAKHPGDKNKTHLLCCCVFCDSFWHLTVLLNLSEPWKQEQDGHISHFFSTSSTPHPTSDFCFTPTRLSPSRPSSSRGAASSSSSHKTAASVSRRTFVWWARWVAWNKMVHAYRTVEHSSVYSAWPRAPEGDWISTVIGWHD